MAGSMGQSPERTEQGVGRGLGLGWHPWCRSVGQARTAQHSVQALPALPRVHPQPLLPPSLRDLSPHQERGAPESKRQMAPMMVVPALQRQLRAWPGAEHIAVGWFPHFTAEVGGHHHYPHFANEKTGAQRG